MISESWLSTEAPLGAYLIMNTLSKRVNYRLHDIVVEVHPGHDATATIFDGSREINMVHAFNEIEAIGRAKQWIDEQDESLAEFDLR